MEYDPIIRLHARDHNLPENLDSPSCISHRSNIHPAGENLPIAALFWEPWLRSQIILRHRPLTIVYYWRCLNAQYQCSILAGQLLSNFAIWCWSAWGMWGLRTCFWRIFHQRKSWSNWIPLIHLAVCQSAFWPLRRISTWFSFILCSGPPRGGERANAQGPGDFRGPGRARNQLVS